MSEPILPICPELYTAVRDAKDYAHQQFRAEGADLNSKQFLARFPFFWVIEYNEDPAIVPIRERLLEIAFSDQYRSRTEQVIEIFYANHSGASPQHYFLDLIDDFLNFALSRTLGLLDEDDQFDGLYRRFEKDLLGDTYTLTVISILQNVSDHSGSFRFEEGLSFRYAMSLLPPNTVFGRSSTMLLLEIMKTQYFHDDNGRVFFVMHFEESRTKEPAELRQIYLRSEELTRKVVFAIRLLTGAAAYCELRGFRTLGHQGGLGTVLMNYPEERIEGGSQDLQLYSRQLKLLFPTILTAPSNSFAVLYDKIEDALRRQRTLRASSESSTQLRATIDRLLDYVQAMEAIFQSRGKYQVALHSALLLRTIWPDVSTAHAFEFVTDMYTLRDEVVHGRIDNVLSGRKKTKHTLAEVEGFRTYVHQLAILYLLNPDPSGKYGLEPLGHRLALGEGVNLKTLNARTLDSVM